VLCIHNTNVTNKDGPVYLHSEVEDGSLEAIVPTG